MTETKDRPRFSTNTERRGEKTLPYRSRGALLSDGERRFYQTGLKPDVGGRYEVSVKVSLIRRAVTGVLSRGFSG